jgi:hypothetical protein
MWMVDKAAETVVPTGCVAGARLFDEGRFHVVVMGAAPLSGWPCELLAPAKTPEGKFPRTA